MDLERILKAEETVFLVGDQPLGEGGEFKYLGRVLDKSDDECPKLYSNLENARTCWGHSGEILGT